MIKDTWDKNENASANKKEITVLKEHFPACFKENGSFDLERFKEYLSEDINIVNEGYELKFLGKNYARLLVTLEPETVIVPNEEHNQKEENKNSENIYITGDNLDGLKHLLKSYAGKVKCIYIDPPYNTGSDGFVYNDNFNFTIEELTEKLSIGEEQAQRILDLTKRGSASHSAWLMFMYPRLQLARDLLSDDGVIFMSIDDNEQSNLKLLCDDIFGEENFSSNILWQKRTSPDARVKLSTSHEYVIVYSRNHSVREEIFNLLPLEEADSKNYTNPDNDPRGPWVSTDFGAQGYRPNQMYTITSPTGVKHTPSEGRCWKNTESVFKDLLKDNRIWFGMDGNGVPRKKVFLVEREGKNTWTWWSNKEVGHTQEATQEFTKLMGSKTIFDYPKPTRLIKRIISLATTDKDIVLDFFSGSATTADALLNQNLKDNSNRKYILVQLGEKTDESSGAYKNGFKTIDEIGRERIIRVANKIRENNPNTRIDLGFKHFTLIEPTSDTIKKLVKFKPNENEMIINNTILDEFGVPTVITTWLNNDGYGLTTEAEKIMFAGYEAYYKDKHLYLVHPELPNETIEELVVKYETDGNFSPENIVLFGYSFTWTELESLKTNLKRLQDTEKNLRINFDVRY